MNKYLNSNGLSSGKVIAIGAMIGSAACWGGGTVMSRDLLSIFPAPILLVVQLISSVIFLLLLSIPQKPWRYLTPRLVQASMTGILEPGLTYSIGLLGLSLTSAGNASVIGATEPIYIVILAWLITHQRPSNRLLFCIVIAIMGLILVSAGGDYAKESSQLEGDLLIVISTLFAAAYVVFSAKYVKGFPASILATSQQIVGLLCAIIICFVIYLSKLVSLEISAITWHQWGYVALSGIVQYSLAFWLYLIGLKYLSASAAALWLTLVPIFGLMGAYLWLNEIPTWIMLLGTALIILAVVNGIKEK